MSRTALALFDVGSSLDSGRIGATARAGARADPDWATSATVRNDPWFLPGLRANHRAAAQRQVADRQLEEVFSCDPIGRQVRPEQPQVLDLCSDPKMHMRSRNVALASRVPVISDDLVIVGIV